MTDSGDARRENEALRERISTLSAAILRISATLDLDTVLREVVESARGLTGARYGVIATVDETGAPTRESVFSGFSPEEERELFGWPDSGRLFEHLRHLPGPLRLADLSGYVRSLGIEPARTFSRTFQGTPMRHRGADVGHFFLADKADGDEFTGDDEEVLMLFASQAAAAIANARTHRSEQRARADLEALIETSPVGVVVFDAQSGRPVSLNREARRIVEGLRMPGRPLEQLLETTVCRRADGREVSLSEFPLAELLGTGEKIRAEEVVLSVPDGRSVRTLINATPIRADGDAVRSVVVTMQDLAPLDEIERMRTEFLGLVSHELRAPLIAIKGSADALLEEAAELDPAEMREFHRIVAEQAAHMRGLIRDLLDAGRIDSGTLSVATEPSEVAALVERARSTFLSGGGRHACLVDLPRAAPPVIGRTGGASCSAQATSWQRREARSRVVSIRSGGGERSTSRSRSRRGEGGWRRSACRICSQATPAAEERAPRRTTASVIAISKRACRSSRRRIGRRAPARPRARHSRSQFRWRRATGATAAGHGARPPSADGHGRVSS
ncbi:MAG: GAF domain-containing protein [Acidobacteria bacterium]|nr:GAF domain-containing protein [Acidobacteriota bacterium]